MPQIAPKAFEPGSKEYKIYRYGLLNAELRRRQGDQRLRAMSEADIGEMRRIELDLEMLPEEIVRADFAQTFSKCEIDDVGKN